MTISGPSSNTPCIFPFTFNDVTYHECILDNDGAWCSTEVDNDGIHVSGQGKWGICGPECPIREYLEKYFQFKGHVKNLFNFFKPVPILTYSYVFLTESPCTEFKFSSTGGISESQPAVIGRYILTSRTENERAIYEHENGGLFLYSLGMGAEPTLDGAWMVQCLHNIIC